MAIATVTLFAVQLGTAGDARAVAPPKPVVHLDPTVYRPAEISADVARIKATAELMDGNFAAARLYAKIAADPTVDKLIAWQEATYARDEQAFERIYAFFSENPDWPHADRLLARAERVLLEWERPAEDVAAFFDSHPPQTVSGKLALARAYEALDRDAAARDLIRASWREDSMPADFEAKILERYGSLIRNGDHRVRLAQRLYERDLGGALRQAKRLSETHAKMAKAALELANGNRAGMKLYEALPERFKSQAIMRFALVRYYRLAGKPSEARKVALKADPFAGSHYDAAAWWGERRPLIRDALKRSSKEAWKAAYEIAKAHGNDAGLPFVEAEFLSGWIALRFLDRPRHALVHFHTLSAGDDRPLNIAQAEYWLGRSYAALGRDVEARRHYHLAGAYPQTFYGQLARAEIGLPRVSREISDERRLPIDTIAKVASSDLFEATSLIARTGRDDLLLAFFTALTERFHTHEERAAIAYLATVMDKPHLTVRIAKHASYKRTDVGAVAYPSPHLDFVRLTPPPELALIYGVIRQESEFHPAAVSHAGARGLMQIMPDTARLLARKHKQPLSYDRLISDPSYNVRLGSALLHELVESFRGSYIMVLAAYNAGPGRVMQWIRDYGDPRKGEIEPVDWIESIPFSETRNYVKRVIENVNVYRAKLTREAPPPVLVDLIGDAAAREQRDASACPEMQIAGLTRQATCE